LKEFDCGERQRDRQTDKGRGRENYEEEENSLGKY